MFVPSTTTWLMPMTGMRMSPIGLALGRGAVCGAVTGGPVGQLVERGLPRPGRGASASLLVSFWSWVRSAGLGVGLLNGGAPDLVRREQEDQDAEPDEDPPEDVDDPP